MTPSAINLENSYIYGNLQVKINTCNHEKINGDSEKEKTMLIISFTHYEPKTALALESNDMNSTLDAATYFTNLSFFVEQGASICL